MIKKILPKSEFSKNVITLMTGTTVAQAIPITITPILTRMYSPEDFGVLALFVAITAILGSIANGRYELAIMLPDSDDDAINIAAMGMLIASILALLLFIPAVFLNDYISAKLENSFIGFWLYFVPSVVWLLGLYNVLNYLNNRKQCYKDMAKATVYKSVAQAAVQLSVGAVKATASGLISGQIASNLAANFRLVVNVKRQYQLSKVSWVEMKRLGRRYIGFPKYSMWATLSNTLSYQLLNMLITVFYSVGTLGFYSLAQRILGMPSSLIGESIGRVYFKQATIEKNNTGKAVKIFNSTTKKLVLFSFLIFLPLYFILPSVFEIAFGQQWRVAGVYSQLILPVFIFRFISAALSTTNSVFEKQGLSLAWQIGLLVLSLFTLSVCGYYQLGFEMFLRAYTVVISLHYILLYCILKKVAGARV
ncbi:lipopolysaccharide biosynthesis protein [Stutzerimonas nitrititolerans]|uniref:lipopolysaccharide biosynthesis protein n=1 Tax=Stutzerimonas nitrititolerans TaxID=2482751 RepID=UPI001482034E|nr:oligosaccharide flippase family protein [Stutzerimonas nitrititolerans]NNT94901.1 oligosaccharide flippase family protein [Stutzerimonas nitrititolerans]